MAEMKWLAPLIAVVLGLGFILQPNLIGALPKVLHYLLGAGLISAGGYSFYKMS